MKERHIYVCEKCGLEIEDDYKAMIYHEYYDHVEPKEFQQPKAIAYNSVDCRYPDIIGVKMKDGAVVEYIYRRIAEFPPKQAESPCGNTDSPEEK